VDLNSEYGIKGLPEEWKKMFKKYEIESDELKANPAVMISIIKGLEA
jgi:predicted butyrate kinase (DUF1464 family)